MDRKLRILFAASMMLTAMVSAQDSVKVPLEEQISNVKGQIDGLNEDYLAAKATVDGLSKLKFGGYIQAQWQHTGDFGLVDSTSAADTVNNAAFNGGSHVGPTFGGDTMGDVRAAAAQRAAGERVGLFETARDAASNAALLARGDTVIIEQDCYQGSINRLTRIGVNVVGIPLDKDGMRVDLLASALDDRFVELERLHGTSRTWRPAAWAGSSSRRRAIRISTACSF